MARDATNFWTLLPWAMTNGPAELRMGFRWHRRATGDPTARHDGLFVPSEYWLALAALS